jgi:hypothetical protein
MSASACSTEADIEAAGGQMANTSTATAAAVSGVATATASTTVGQWIDANASAARAVMEGRLVGSVGR